ncbi:MAG: VTT domain-containing protein [Nocardioides sp.]
MSLLLGTLGFAFLSALVPVFNVEAYLAVLATRSTGVVALVAAAAAAGQMVGKVLWYLAGSSALHLKSVERKLAQPKWQRSLRTWQDRTHGRPYVAAGITFASAFAGVPPYAVIAVMAGVLRMSLPLFVLTGLVGRFLRFLVILELASAAWLIVH